MTNPRVTAVQADDTKYSIWIHQTYWYSYTNFEIIESRKKGFNLLEYRYFILGYQTTDIKQPIIVREMRVNKQSTTVREPRVSKQPVTLR